MAIEGFCMELLKSGAWLTGFGENRAGLQDEAVTFRLWQEFGAAMQNDFISQCPQRVKTKGLVAGSVRDDICHHPGQDRRNVIHGIE